MAVRWVSGLAELLVLLGIDKSDVQELIDAWMGGRRPVLMLTATDETTGTKYAHIYGIAPSGAALRLTATVLQPDIFIFAVVEMDENQIAEYKNWEAES